MSIFAIHFYIFLCICADIYFLNNGHCLEYSISKLENFAHDYFKALKHDTENNIWTFEKSFCKLFMYILVMKFVVNFYCERVIYVFIFLYIFFFYILVDLIEGFLYIVSIIHF